MRNMILTTDSDNIETHGKRGYTPYTRRKFYPTCDNDDPIRPDPRVFG